LPLRGSNPDDLRPASFEEEESANLRRHFLRQVLRWTLTFGGLFAAVFFAFWWSGDAIRFGASRVAERPVASWRLVGTVRSAATHEPVPWASIDDDASGQPLFSMPTPINRARSSFSRFPSRTVFAFPRPATAVPRSTWAGYGSYSCRGARSARKWSFPQSDPPLL